jgi:putative transposase
MLVRYRYRLDPTSTQITALRRVFGCARVVFNDAITLREAARATGRYLSDGEVQSQVIAKAKRTSERSWLSEVSSDALGQAVRDCHRAYRNFLDSLAGERKGPRIGRPRFRSRKASRQSIRRTRNGFRLRTNGRLYLAKIGEVRVRWSRALPSTPSSVTVIQESDGRFYASFVVEVKPDPLPRSVLESGVDLGLAMFATVVDTSGATRQVANPRFLSRKLRKVRRQNRCLSRKQPDSSNRAKARLRLAVTHRKIRDARLDHAHKQALALVRDNQVIHAEDLHVAGMVKNRRLARAIHETGWAQFVTVLTDKCARYGRTLQKVSRWLPSSQLCSGCGYRDTSMTLAVRRWNCRECGEPHDRDVNAAKNILAAGQADRLNASGDLLRLPSEAEVIERGTDSISDVNVDVS